MSDDFVLPTTRYETDAECGDPGKPWNTRNRVPLTEAEKRMVADNAAAASAYRAATLRARAQRQGGNAAREASSTAGAVSQPPGVPSLPRAPAPPPPTSPGPGGASLEARCIAAWKTDEAIRDEFGSLSTYVAFTRADEAGHVKICGDGAGTRAPLRQSPARERTPFVSGTSPATSSLPVEERCRASWNADPAIRDEFGSLSTYVAFTRADEAGQAKILGKRP